jgi:hypothetical protein
VSIIIDRHILIIELNNQFSKRRPGLQILEEVKIGVCLPHLTLDVTGQQLFGLFDGVFHLIGINVFPGSGFVLVELFAGVLDLCPEFFDDIDVEVDVLNGVLGGFDCVLEAEHL